MDVPVTPQTPTVHTVVQTGTEGPNTVGEVGPVDTTPVVQTEAGWVEGHSRRRDSGSLAGGWRDRDKVSETV